MTMGPAAPAASTERRRQVRGLTLIEVVIALAVLVLLLTLALPSFDGQLQRQRLKATAQTLAADLAEARFEAAQRGQPLFIGIHGGADWCWAVTTTSGCGCQQPQACRLKVVSGAEVPGISLHPAPEITFDPGGSGLPAVLLLHSERGQTLRVELSPMGRVRVCAPEPISGLPRC